MPLWMQCLLLVIQNCTVVSTSVTRHVYHVILAVAPTGGVYHHPYGCEVFAARMFTPSSPDSVDKGIMF